MRKKMHVMILGDGAVGKTSILKKYITLFLTFYRYATGGFTNSHIKTIGKLAEFMFRCGLHPEQV